MLAEWERKQKQAVVERLRAMFIAADTDGSGFLTVDELRAHYELPEFKAPMQAFGTLEELVRLFDLCDVDGGGARSADEFLDGMTRYEENKVLCLCT